MLCNFIVGRTAEESYQCDAISAMMQLNESHFQRMHTFRLEVLNCLTTKEYFLLLPVYMIYCCSAVFAAIFPFCNEREMLRMCSVFHMRSLYTYCCMDISMIVRLIRGSCCC